MTHKRVLFQEFNVHPVGQGLFYSGIIRHYGQTLKQFKFVFDCGSNTDKAGAYEATRFNGSHLRKKSGRREEEGETDRLELLVISHFDADHVNCLQDLLAGGVKIDTLVLPFTSFAERLSLVLFHIMSVGSVKGMDSFFIRFALDPLGALGGNLDDRSEVYFVSGGPLPPPDDSNRPKEEDIPIPEEIPGFSFEFDSFTGLSESQQAVLQIPVAQASSFGDRLRTVEHSVKGKLLFSRAGTEVMEFIFYRKGISDIDEAFYQEIHDAFCGLLGIDPSLSADGKADEIKEKIHTIQNGRKIKKIYADAVDRHPEDFKGRKTKAKDINATALCMLHVYNASLRSSFVSQRAYLVQKFHKTGPARLAVSFPFRYHSPYRFHSREYRGLSFPNCLLTSDSYLLKAAEVEEFFRRYGSYRERFWLFQIPHHGSKNNSNRTLFLEAGRLPFNFINYGTTHRSVRRYRHPDKEVISEMMVAGCHSRSIGVNEFSGLRFSFSAWS